MPGTGDSAALGVTSLGGAGTGALLSSAPMEAVHPIVTSIRDAITNGFIIRVISAVGS